MDGLPLRVLADKKPRQDLHNALVRREALV
jgi:hypothetical protein